MSAQRQQPPSSRSGRSSNPDRDIADWTGPKIRYDLIKEFTIALVVVALLTVLLASLFSSPDDKPVTLKSWAASQPLDFAQTAITELNGTSETATYGPPFNNSPGAGQKIGPISLQRIPGVTHPINTALDFVIGPLQSDIDTPGLRQALAQFRGSSTVQRTKWETRYANALGSGTFRSDTLHVKSGDYGPIATMISSLLTMARSGALDGALLRSSQFYGTDYTKPLMFLADGTYLANVGNSYHVQGTQWGMMNETGNYPGQAWLWLYTMWYQIPPFTTSHNADALIWAIMMVLTLCLALVPFIPGLRSIPRITRIYKIIWRSHYKRLKTSSSS